MFLELEQILKVEEKVNMIDNFNNSYSNFDDP